MRSWWVGILVLLIGSALYAQAQGTVESIGLQGYYRAECWVPMRVQLQATSESAAELQIRVIQEDLDRDRVVAVRNVTITPDVAGRTPEQQRYWMYFRPQPTDKGLQDAAIGGSPKVLDQQLKVVLTTTGGTTIANLPITQQGLRRLDVGDSLTASDLRPVRFVLCVTDGMSQLPSGYRDLDGLAEPPLFVAIGPRDLPEDVRGYEMVDAIVWLGGAAPDPKRPTEEPRFRAIEQYVRQGGALVVCQGPESAKTQGFESILPVRVNGYRDTDDLMPLPQMGQLDWTTPPAEANQTRRFALGTAKPGSLVIREKTSGEETKPFVVRSRLGAGCVTWVAQDLGESTTVRALRRGMGRIWDEVLGWRNTPTPMKAPASNKRSPYEQSGNGVDLGKSFEHRGNLGLTASGYVLMAVLFFAVYWVIAGPGLYAWLSIRKMATLNWFMFGIVAVCAAMLAAIVVRAIQSRSPALEHITLIRAAAGEYATVQSRIGLYVPSDGMKELQIKDTTPNTTNWITPYPTHPARVEDASQFLAMKQYEMPVLDASSEEPVTVSMPWRSTMKHVQVRWNGDLAHRVTGDVRLTGRAWPEITGTIANGTPWVLRDVYLVYRSTALGDGSNAKGDKVIYIPSLDSGQSVDLTSVLSSDNLYRIGPNTNPQLREAVPGDGKVVYGGIELSHADFGNEVPLGEGWVGFWYSRDVMRPQAFGMVTADDSGTGYQAAFPLCSLFDRIPPMRNQKDGDNYKDTRREVARIGVRYLNISPAVAAGNLVVLARAKGELPIPFTVDGKVPKGEGSILCQYIIPLGRGPAVSVEK